MDKLPRQQQPCLSDRLFNSASGLLRVVPWKAGAAGGICAMHRVADLALLVLRLTGQICAANPSLPGVGPPLVCWVDRRFNHMPWEEDSLQSFSAGGRSGVVLLPENVVTKLEVKGGKWGSDCF